MKLHIIEGCNKNTVSANYSAILGGSGNTVAAAYQYAGIFGQNVAAVASNTFHIECLNICAIPIAYSGLDPKWTVFTTTTPPGATCALPLYIKII